jgi:hypothetical protein
MGFVFLLHLFYFIFFSWESIRGPARALTQHRAGRGEHDSPQRQIWGFRLISWVDSLGIRNDYIRSALS